MNLTALYAILKDTTLTFRKGPEVEHTGGVTHIYAMPPAPQSAHDLASSADQGQVMIDCHFLMVGVDLAAAEQHRAELLEILATYPQPDRLAGGPSYIEVGGEIGDQGAAFQLFALGQALGLWQVITPATVGVTGSLADTMAGSGFVMITGFKPQP